jgi:hypothetical protein
MFQVPVLATVDKVEIAIVWKRKMIKNLFKKMLGIDKLEENLKMLKDMETRAVTATAEAQLAEKEAKDAEEQAKMTPKERANARGEAWVAVLDTHVNKDNIRNGFFELDWNPQFVVQLKQAGYGFEGDPEEEIVDRWFRDLARNMLGEEGQDPTRVSAGYINVSKLGNGKASVE